MQRIRLGQTKVDVSRLIYGTEPFNFKKGPDGDRTQGDKTPEEGGLILKQAMELGVNTWDTSDDYGTHPHVAADTAADSASRASLRFIPGGASVTSRTSTLLRVFWFCLLRLPYGQTGHGMTSGCAAGS